MPTRSTIDNGTILSSDSSHVQNKNEWVKLNADGCSNPGRVSVQNIFTVKPGLKNVYKKNIYCERDAWNLLMNEHILRSVQKYTQLSGVDVTSKELLSFIGLQYARGLYGKHHSVHSLWSDRFGVKLFPKTMGRDRFIQLKKHLTFTQVVHRFESAYPIGFS